MSFKQVMINIFTSLVVGVLAMVVLITLKEYTNTRFNSTIIAMVVGGVIGLVCSISEYRENKK